MKKQSSDNADCIIVETYYTITKAGVSLAFKIPVRSSVLSDIVNTGTGLVEFVSGNFIELISGRFYAKSSSPYLFAKDDGMYMLWAFSGKNNEETIDALENRKIRKIENEA